MDSDATQAIGSVGIHGDISDSDAKRVISQALALFYKRPKVLNKILLRTRRGITSLEAQEAIRAAINARKNLGDNASPGVYAVRDVSGYLRAFYYEDGCEKGAQDLALKTAKASSLFMISSDKLGQHSQPNMPLWNVELLFGGLIPYLSAVPLLDSDGTVIGSIGVSGTGNGKGTANDGLIANEVAAYVATLNDPCASSAGHCIDVIPPITTPNISDASPFSDEVLSLAQVAALINEVQKYGKANQAACCTTAFDAGMRLKGTNSVLFSAFFFVHFYLFLFALRKLRSFSSQK